MEVRAKKKKLAQVQLYALKESHASLIKTLFFKTLFDVIVNIITMSEETKDMVLSIFIQTVQVLF